MEDAADRPETAAVEGRSREEKLSRASPSDSDEMYSGASHQGGKVIPPSGDVIEPDVLIIPHVMDKTLILNRNYNNPPPPSTVSLLDVRGGDAAGYRKATQDQRELYLKTLHSLADSHNFYCPNCKSCITKVIILRDGPSPPSPPPLLGSNGGAPHLQPSQPPSQIPREPPPPPSASQPQSYIPKKQPPASHRPAVGESSAANPETISGDEGGSFLCGNCFGFLVPIGAWISSQIGFGHKKPAIQVETAGTTATTSRPETDIGISHVGSSGISHEPEVEGDDRVVVSIPPDGNESAASGGRRLEIIKSIVYGGLTESITSLGIVTSAASAKTPTENIVALALANLITGLIVIVNNLSGLKSNQLEKKPNETEEAQVDPYEEALGDRQHYLLHFTTAILSFLLFGLLPPLVYGFSFGDTDDGDLKLAAVAAASLLCIALLAVGKAYIQKSHEWQEFAKTIVYYIALGFGASGLSYLAGKEFDKLLEQLGWFKRHPMAPPTLLLPDMGFAKPAWGSS